MRLAEYLNQRLILTDLVTTHRISAVKELLDHLGKSYVLSDSLSLFQTVSAQSHFEEFPAAGSSADPFGAVLLRVSTPLIPRSMILIGISRRGIGFLSPRNEHVRILALLLCPPVESTLLVRIGTMLAERLEVPAVREGICRASDVASVTRWLDPGEARASSESPGKEPTHA